MSIRFPSFQLCPITVPMVNMACVVLWKYDKYERGVITKILKNSEVKKI